MTETVKREQKIEQNWVIANRGKMESEFGVHVNALSCFAVCKSKLEVLKILANMTKKQLSWMVVSEFDIINGKPQKYKIGTTGPDFLESASVLLN